MRAFSSRRAALCAQCCVRFNTTDASVESNSFGDANPSEAGASTAHGQARTHYHRRTSNPETLRQRGDFQRDLKYGKRRPLPDAPWRQIKAKTYLDDAERLYGRKEGWHLVEDDVLREKLVTILQDYLRDTVGAIRLESRDASKYRRMCDLSAKEYRAHIVAGAYSSPALLRMWAQRLLTSPNTAETAGTNEARNRVGAHSGDGDEVAFSRGGASPDDANGTLSSEDTNAGDAEWLEARQRRGREAIVEGTPAMSDLPRSDAHTPSLSAFPFLRQRAVEDEHSLDPSLVDWTAKYFPDDTAATFAAPPKLRQRRRDADSDDVAEDAATSDTDARGRQQDRGESTPAFTTRTRARARHRLQSSLRAHNDRNRATFDAEGAFFHVRRQTDESERAPKPKPVRGSDESFTDSKGGVVKVPWGVVSAAKQRGYSTDTLRAKERLVRLSRGEDPETIP